MTRAVAQLGYLGFGVSDLQAWEHFATQILGLQLCNRTPEGFDLRLDSYQRRFLVRHDSCDDLILVGWQARDETSFNAVVDNLHKANVTVNVGDQNLCSDRGVEKIVRFHDPAGIPCELALGYATADLPFESDIIQSGFVAEEEGLGHLVVTSKDQKQSEQFYQEVLGFGFSDRIACELYGFDIDVAFFHTNPRHHSLAVGGQQQKRIHHFMIEAKAMDEVGCAYDRCIRNKVPIINTLGRHPNDKMFSFYALTPSGFQFEFGWGGQHVDPMTHPPGNFDYISEWGHHPPAMLAPRRKKP